MSRIKSDILAVIWIVLLSISGATSFGQTYHLKKEVIDMFDDSKGDLWITTYEGLDDFNYPVDFILGHSGEVYKGLMHYPDTKAKLFYSGVQKYESIILTEETELGVLVGKLILNIEDGYAVGKWSTDKYIDERDFVFVTDKINKRKWSKSKDLLAARYIGEINGEEVVLKCYFRNSSVNLHLLSSGKVQSIELDRVLPDQYFSDSSISVNGKVVQNLSVTTTDLGLKLSLESIKTDHVEFVFTQQLHWQSKLYANPYAQVHLQSFDDSYGALSDWIREKDKKLSLAIAVLKERAESGYYGQSARYVEQVGLDIEVSYLDEKYLSGDIVSYDLEKIEREAFVYNISRDKVLFAEDIIDTRRMPAGSLIKVDSKDTLMISEQGIELVGEFDPIHGSERKVISFQELRNEYSDIIKSNSFRKHFLK